MKRLYIIDLGISRSTDVNTLADVQASMARAEERYRIMVWILLVLAYGLIKGFREILKKKALMKSSVIEVLFLYTFISFLFVIPEVRNGGSFTPTTMLIIAGKSFAIFVAWLCGFTAIEHMPVSLYGILDLARVPFSTLFGIIILHETLGITGTIGFILVFTGLIMLKFVGGGKKAAVPTVTGSISNTASEKVTPYYVILTLISCFLNALSGLLDKVLMSRPDVTDGGLQFWYMLFLVIYYLLYILIKRPKADWKGALKNYWIWILAVCFVIADRCLFVANGYPDSKVTVMTLIKQSCCIVTVVCGKIFFKEKNILRKLACAGIILLGIVISLL